MFEHYDPRMHMDNIISRNVDRWVKDDWEPVSLGETNNGMSILLKRIIK